MTMVSRFLVQKITKPKGKKFWDKAEQLNTIGPVTIDLKVQKKNAYIFSVMIRNSIAWPQEVFFLGVIIFCP